jgi:hypothetical protein
MQLVVNRELMFLISLLFSLLSCAATGVCSTGDATGPASPEVCAYTSWAYPQCPCEYAYDCTTCTQNSACGWCGSMSTPYTGTCLSSSGYYPSPGTNCSSTFYTDYAICPSIQPTPWNAPDFSAAGTAAVTLLSLTTLLLMVRILILGCVASQRPQWGLRLNLQIAGRIVIARDYSSMHSRLLPGLFLLPSLLLKLLSLGLDRWDRDSQAGIWWGLLRQRFDALIDSSSGGASESWADLCSLVDKTEATDSTDDVVCTIGSIGGIFTLITGIFCTLFIAAATVLFLLGVFKAAEAHRKAMSQWYLTTLAATFSLAAISYWLLVGHMAVHHLDGNNTLSTSWILMVISFVADCAAVGYYRRAIEHQVNPNGGAGAQYVQLPYGAGVQQQQQQQQISPQAFSGQPRQMANHPPSGYGYPPQQQQQAHPQHFYANQQQPPQQPLMWYPPQGQQAQGGAYQPPRYAPPPYFAHPQQQQQQQQQHQHHPSGPVLYGSAPPMTPAAPPAPIGEGEGEGTTQ